jgi:2-iminobutanoate/2-iminopropanoate deaminase
MKPVLLAAALMVAPFSAHAAEVKHFPAGTGTPGGVAPPFSASVLAGDTLYVAGATDGADPSTGKLPVDAKTGAAVVLNNIKRTVEAAGLTMDDLTWVQIFTSDLKYYADFNEVYRTYFKGPMPARAFIGAGSLLGGAHFEVMGIAVKPTVHHHKAK